MSAIPSVRLRREQSFLLAMLDFSCQPDKRLSPTALSLSGLTISACDINAGPSSSQLRLGETLVGP